MKTGLGSVKRNGRKREGLQRRREGRRKKRRRIDGR